MAILVTGAGGFIGQSFLNHFEKLDIISLYHSKQFNNKNNIFHLDLTNLNSLYKSLEGKKIDTIFHFAAVTPFSKSNNKIDFNKDIKMAEHLMQVCKLFRIKKLIFTNGWIVYDPKNKTPYKETSKLNPNTDYGKSKLAVESYFKNKLKTTKLINLRLSSVYGPGQLTSGLIPNLVNSAISTNIMTINTIQSRRDYLYIEDLNKIFGSLIKKNITNSIDLNIGSGTSVSVLDVALYIQDIMYSNFNKQTELIIKSPLTISSPGNNVLDISKAEKYFSKFNRTDIKNGLFLYIKWMLKK